MLTNVKPRILLVAATTGYQTREFGGAADRLGAELVLATDRCHVLSDPWGDHAIPVRFDHLEESARRVAKRDRCDGIVAVGDRPAHLAALIAGHWGVPFHASMGMAAARNKHAAHALFREAGLPVCKFYKIDLAANFAAEAERAPYPCVLKPLGLSGSRGVIRADNPAGFVSAAHQIAELLREPDITRLSDAADRYLQVEEFIPGREFALEGLVSHGRLRVLALFDKPDPLDGPHFEESIYVTPSREASEVQQSIASATQQAVTALGLTHGPIHAEMRVNERGVWMLEVAGRPIGGLCARALTFDAGWTLEELILRHALGQDVSSAEREKAASGVLMIPVPGDGFYQGVDGLDQAARIAEVVVTAKEGQRLRPLPEGNSYPGFIFARADTATAVEAALRQAHQCLNFRLAPVLAMQRG